ncbi:MAG: VOC family protein [Rhodothermaceae bacterium]|nr:VOC family protein [Rhodothermaceae bacterium]
MIDPNGSLFIRLVLPICFIVTGLALFLSLEACNPKGAPSADIESSQSQNPEVRVALDVGIVVSDMDASLAFYRDLLGLPVIAEVRTSLIGAGTMVQLRHGASLIKLVQMDEPPGAKTETGITTTLGHRYVTLMVSDISYYGQKIKEAGSPVAMPLTELGNGAKIIMVEDPDGNIIEFVQEGI